MRCGVVVLKHGTPERLAEKLGWLEEYRDAVGEWASWQAVVDLVVKFVNLHGHFADAATAGLRVSRVGESENRRTTPR